MNIFPRGLVTSGFDTPLLPQMTMHRQLLVLDVAKVIASNIAMGLPTPQITY